MCFDLSNALAVLRCSGTRLPAWAALAQEIASYPRWQPEASGPQPPLAGLGQQLSSRILDGAFFPLVGVTLLRYGSLAEPTPEPRSERREAMQVARRRDNAVRLCRLGVISLSLLAVWQFALFMGSLATLDQRSNSQSVEVAQSPRQAERSMMLQPSPTSSPAGS